MTVVINRADLWNDLIESYPCLEKYREWYVPKKDEYIYCEYENCIIKEMNNDELFNIIQELTSYSKLIIGYANEYDHKEYEIDFVITIYDYYVE